MWQSIAIANHFVNVYKQRPSNDLTPMKVLKQVWFADGWWRGTQGSPLITDERPECWPWGPVYPDLYHSAKKYGNQPIRSLLVPNLYGVDFAQDPPNLESAFPNTDKTFLIDFLDQIDQHYGKYPGSKLSNMTHLPNTPWKEVFDKYNGQPPKNEGIPNDLIMKYFKRLAEEAKQKTAAG